MNNFDPGLWDELCLALSACQLVLCLYTLCCSGPVGRLATVSLIACCVRTVRLTSLAGGPFFWIHTDPPPRYDNWQPLFYVFLSIAGIRRPKAWTNPAYIKHALS